MDLLFKLLFSKSFKIGSKTFRCSEENVGHGGALDPFRLLKGGKATIEFKWD